MHPKENMAILIESIQVLGREAEIKKMHTLIEIKIMGGELIASPDSEEETKGNKVLLNRKLSI